MTEPAVMVEDATEPNQQQQNWGTMEGGGNGGGGMGEMGARMDGIGVIKGKNCGTKLGEIWGQNCQKGQGS
jgi:hypothetical protein